MKTTLQSLVVSLLVFPAVVGVAAVQQGEMGG
jgi:hypothetical protein